MHRTARVAITSAFVIACLGLWLLVTITARVYPPTLYNGEYPLATQWMLKSTPLLLIAPGVAIIFCGFSFKRASAETNVLLGAVFALVLAAYFAAIAFTILLPWIPHS
jgi:hypothetical protein